MQGDSELAWDLNLDLPRLSPTLFNFFTLVFLDDMHYMNPFQMKLQLWFGIELALITLIADFHWDRQWRGMWSWLKKYLDFSVAFDTISWCPLTYCVDCIYGMLCHSSSAVTLLGNSRMGWWKMTVSYPLLWAVLQGITVLFYILMTSLGEFSWNFGETWLSVCWWSLFLPILILLFLYIWIKSGSLSLAWK